MTIFSMLLSSAPTVFYSITAFIKEETSTEEKCILMSCIFISILLFVIVIANKSALSCRILLILPGFYFCRENIWPYIEIVAITQILDEIAISPISSHIRKKYSINKELDKRGVS